MKVETGVVAKRRHYKFIVVVWNVAHIPSTGGIAQVMFLLGGGLAQWCVQRPVPPRERYNYYLYTHVIHSKCATWLKCSCPLVFVCGTSFRYLYGNQISTVTAQTFVGMDVLRELWVHVSRNSSQLLSWSYRFLLLLQGSLWQQDFSDQKQHICAVTSAWTAVSKPNIKFLWE